MPGVTCGYFSLRPCSRKVRQVFRLGCRTLEGTWVLGSCGWRLDVHVAPFGDGDGVGKRLGNVREERGHFRRAT